MLVILLILLLQPCTPHVHYTMPHLHVTYFMALELAIVQLQNANNRHKSVNILHSTVKVQTGIAAQKCVTHSVTMTHACAAKAPHQIALFKLALRVMQKHINVQRGRR